MARHRAKPEQPHRLMMDFTSAEQMMNFIAELREQGAITNDVHAYPPISLDFSKGGGGIGRKNTFLLRNDKSELNEMRGEPFAFVQEVVLS